MPCPANDLGPLKPSSPAPPHIKPWHPHHLANLRRSNCATRRSSYTTRQATRASDVSARSSIPRTVRDSQSPPSRVAAGETPAQPHAVSPAIPRASLSAAPDESPPQQVAPAPSAQENPQMPPPQ